MTVASFDQDLEMDLLICIIQIYVQFYMYNC